MDNNRDIVKSRYLDFFRGHADSLREASHLVGDILLIERIEFPEARTASGLIIAQSNPHQLNTLTADRPMFYRVLMSGEGYYDDTTKESIPLDTQPGDIIQTGSVSVRMFSSFPLLESYKPDTIGFTRESDVQWRFKGEQAFAHFLAQFNQAVKPQAS